MMTGCSALLVTGFPVHTTILDAWSRRNESGNLGVRPTTVFVEPVAFPHFLTRDPWFRGIFPPGLTVESKVELGSATRNRRRISGWHAVTACVALPSSGERHGHGSEDGGRLEEAVESSPQAATKEP